MTTTVTMTTAVLGPSGIMAADSTQVLPDDLAAELIHSKRATRVTPQDTGGGQMFYEQFPGGGGQATAGGQAVALGGGGEILPPYKVGFFGDSRNNSFTVQAWRSLAPARC
jgi:hypothetical protein